MLNAIRDTPTFAGIFNVEIALQAGFRGVAEPPAELAHAHIISCAHAAYLLLATIAHNFGDLLDLRALQSALTVVTNGLRVDGLKGRRVVSLDPSGL